jgi:ribose 5-phosphate isomerase
MACYNIMTLVVNNRAKNAPKLQQELTKAGCMIKVRLGLHEAGDVCSNDGLIILQLTGSKEEIAELEKNLNALDGIVAKNNELCASW